MNRKTRLDPVAAMLEPILAQTGLTDDRIGIVLHNRVSVLFDNDQLADLGLAGCPECDADVTFANEQSCGWLIRIHHDDVCPLYTRHRNGVRQ